MVSTPHSVTGVAGSVPRASGQCPASPFRTPGPLVRLQRHFHGRVRPALSPASGAGLTACVARRLPACPAAGVRRRSIHLVLGAQLPLRLLPKPYPLLRLELSSG